MIMARKQTIVLDFDGVIHPYTRGWQDGSIYDEPLPSCGQKLQQLLHNYNLAIVSTRAAEQIVVWMQEKFPEIACELIPPGEVFWNKEGVIGVSNYKIAAAVYIDDRALRFRSWHDITEANLDMHIF